MRIEARRRTLFMDWALATVMGAMAWGMGGSIHAAHADDDWDDDSADAGMEIVRMEREDGLQESGQYCVQSICVGMYVQAVTGSFQGESGAVVGIDEGNATATVVNGKGTYLYPQLSEIVPQNDMSWDGCYGPVCVGDKVKLRSGPFKRKKGFVVGIDVSKATALVYVKRKKAYTSISIEDLKIKRREIYSEPYPVRYSYHHYSACDPWSVFDVYRGCVRVYHGVWHYHPVPARMVVVRRVYSPRYRPVVVRRPNRVIIQDDAYPTPRTNPRGPRTSPGPNRGSNQGSGTVTTPGRSSTSPSRGTVTTPGRSSSGSSRGTVTSPGRSSSGSSRGTVSSPSRSSSGSSRGTVSSPSRSSGSSSPSRSSGGSSGGSGRSSGGGSSRGPR
jgi:ribosomal protein L24